MNIDETLKRVSKEAEHGTVLDAGCGNFNTLKKLSEQFNFQSLIGVDIVKPENIPFGFEFLNCNFDTEKIPVEDNSVDLVISQHVIEHLTRPVEYFSELVRILKPGGRIFIEAPSDKSTAFSYPFQQHKRLILSYYDDPTHVGRPWTPQSFYRLGEFFNMETLITKYEQSYVDFIFLPLEYLRWLITSDADRFVTKYWSAKGWVSFAVLQKNSDKCEYNYVSFKGAGDGNKLKW